MEFFYQTLSLVATSVLGVYHLKLKTTQDKEKFLFFGFGTCFFIRVQILEYILSVEFNGT